MQNKKIEEIKEQVKEEISKKEMTDDMFIGFNENGEKVTFYKLLEFDSNETGKHYLAYTDNTTDENGNLRAYGSVVVQVDDLVKLEPITTEKEWKVIEVALQVLQESSDNSDEEE